MAYEEYLDLYLLAQKNPNSLYYVVSFDTIDSRLMLPEKREMLQNNIDIIVKYVYNKLLDKELELNKQVVIKDKRFIRPWDFRTSNWNGNYIDPSVFGDSFGFTVLRDTVTKEEIIKWVNECKNILNMEEEFHIADGYYETNEYGEGGIKFFRGYCLQTLETLHKPRIKKELEKIAKKVK